MISFNHEQFIAQAIESILMQKTNFDFELVIGEDYSTDDTRKICEEYAKKKPKTIRLLPSQKNLGMMNNFIRTLQNCDGKYIAICEGDDYWTDPLKLQKQVDFLENNLDFNICYHNASIWKNEAILSSKIYKPNQKQIVFFEDLLRGNYTKTCCSVFRFDSSVFNLPVDILQDTTLFLNCLKNGAKAYYINEDMAVYRIHEGGVWGLQSSLNQLLSKFKIYEYLLGTYPQQQYTSIIHNKLKKFTVEISFIYLKQLNFTNFFAWHKKSFRYYTNNTFTIYYNLLRKYFFNQKIFKK